jgi:PRC-barrel domain protein
MLGAMDDLGEPNSYMALRAGTPVYSSDGEKLGEVEHVLADNDLDLFDGFVVDTSVLPGGHRFVDAPQVEMIYDRGVVLTIDAATAQALPKPSANPGSIEVGPADMTAASHDKLRRAWDLITGKS